MRRENLILKKTSKTRSSRGKAPIRMTNEKHPPRRINGTPPRRGIVEFIPPLRGDLRGVCLVFFCLFFFHQY